MKKINFSGLWVLFAVLLLSSCFDRGNADWTFTQDNSVSSELFQDIYKQVDEATQSEGSLKSCAQISLADTLGNFPNTLTIEFGATGCLGTDGRTRRGTIEASFTGRWRDPNTVVTITLTDYQVNDYLVEGTVVVTNNGRNNAGNLSYSVETQNGNITNADGDLMQWSGTTTYEWVTGENTTFFSHGVSGIRDDVYHITGSSNGINRNGTAYTAEITNYLVRQLDCKWITQGSIEVTPENGDVRTIDFGSGSCDATVTFSFRQWTFNFLLP